jgi:multiple sugar transport system substrate-binding protein
MISKRNVSKWLLLTALLAFVVTFSSKETIFAKKSVTIKFGSWWFTEAGKDTWLNAHLNKFEKENPGIKVERISYNFLEVQDKFMTEAAAGKGPDVLWFRDNSVVPFVEFKFLEPLDKWINFSKYHLEECNSGGVVNGKRYALNCMAFPYGQLIYNKKIFDEAGLKPPTTPTELIEIAKKLTKAPDRYGFGMPVVPGETEYFAQNIQKFASGFGAAISKNGKIAVNDPAFIKGVEWLKKVYDANIVPKGIGWKVQRRMLAEDKVVMLFDGAYQWDLIDGYHSGHSKVFYAAHPPFPSNNIMFTCNMIGMNSASKHKAEVAQFLKWWMRKDNQMEFNMCGKHTGTVKTDFPNNWLKANGFMKVYNDPKIIPTSTVVVGFEKQSEQIRRTMVNYVTQIVFNNKPIVETMNELQKVLENMVK